MAVDYLHRLLITGRHEAVRRLVQALYREYPRTVAGQTWTEIVPVSFDALYELAPNAVRVEREVPCDPYELAAWPVRKRTTVESEARYQFQTRNLEMAALVRVLARKQPRLTFTLVTLCLDDSSIESHEFTSSSSRRWTLPQRRRAFHWERARRKFKLTGDDVYDDDVAEGWAEEQMMAEALDHWRQRGGRSARKRRYGWWNQARLRDLATERMLALHAVADLMSASGQDRRRGRKSRSPRSRRGE